MYGYCCNHPFSVVIQNAPPKDPVLTFPISEIMHLLVEVANATKDLNETKIYSYLNSVIEMYIKFEIL